MTQKLQEVASNYKDGPTALGQLYVELVPAMIICYRKGGSDYWDKLDEQASAYLKDKNLDKFLRVLRAKTD
jgi:hypothetical protein